MQFPIRSPYGQRVGKAGRYTVATIDTEALIDHRIEEPFSIGLHRNALFRTLFRAGCTATASFGSQNLDHII